MIADNPFQYLFESPDRPPRSHTEVVNRHAFQRLVEALAVPLDAPGKCVLLRAPRAGHGKSHLLACLQGHFAADHEFIPLQPAGGCRIDAQSVTDDVLRRLGRTLPASGGLCALDLLVRRLYSLALDPLVSSGEVPCVDRDSALASLRNRPLETFDFHHPGAITAHWVRDHFTALGPRLALELANLTGVPPRAAGFWMEALFHFAVAPVDQPGRVEALALTAYHTGGNAGLAMERLAALLALLSRLTRVVLVADDLDGFATDSEAGLGLAALLAGLRHAADRVEVVLSVNQDIWERAFLRHLSGGLMDRLTEQVIDLEPLAAAEAVALIESRMPGFGAKVLASLGAEGLPGHARGILKAAAEIWLVMNHAGDAAPSHEPSRPRPTVAAAAAITPATTITTAVQPAPTPLEPPPASEAAAPAPPEAGAGAPRPSADGEPAEEPGPAQQTEPGPDTAAAAPILDFAAPASGRTFASPAPSVEAPPREAVPMFGASPSWNVIKRDEPNEPPPVRERPAPETGPESAPEPAAVAPPPLPPATDDWHEAVEPTTPFSEPHEDAPDGSDQPPPPAKTADSPVAPAPPAEPPVDQDRIEQLLRQFRERYNRPGS